LQEVTHDDTPGLIDHDVTGISAPKFEAPPARERSLALTHHCSRDSIDISANDPYQTASSRNNIACLSDWRSARAPQLYLLADSLNFDPDVLPEITRKRGRSFASARSPGI
jgi:hypothetical protein